jgi:branched-chain amino acid transport system permease protein
MNRYKQAAIGVVALAVVPFIVGRSSFLMRLSVEMGYLALFAIAINVAFGHTDQLFLFMGGLAGVGAYTTALLAKSIGITAWLTLPLGVVFAAFVAGLVSYVSARREFTVILISILTLNLQLAFLSFFVGARNITRGTTGFGYSGLVPDALGDTLQSATGLEPTVILYYLVVVFIAVALLIYVRLIESKYGLAFDAIREDETAAASIGIDVVRYKTVAGIVTGALIGLTGPVIVELQDKFLTPALFEFLRIDVIVLIVIVLGGLRTTLGPIVGAALVVAIEEALLLYTNFQVTIFGALLIVLFLYFRRGIVPAAGDVLDRFDLPVGGDGGGGKPPEPDADGGERSGS